MLLRGPRSVLTFCRWKRVVVVDMRPFSIVVQLDGVLARDDLPVRVNGQVEGQVVDPVAAVVTVVDYTDATRMIAETVIRAVLKERGSNDLVGAPRELEAEFGEEVERAIRDWGLVLLSASLDITAGL